MAQRLKAAVTAKATGKRKNFVRRIAGISDGMSEARFSFLSSILYPSSCASSFVIPCTHSGAYAPGSPFSPLVDTSRNPRRRPQEPRAKSYVPGDDARLNHAAAEPINLPPA